jgi:hypothetical protein
MAVVSGRHGCSSKKTASRAPRIAPIFQFITRSVPTRSPAVIDRDIIGGHDVFTNSLPLRLQLLKSSRGGAELKRFFFTISEVRATVNLTVIS